MTRTSTIDRDPAWLGSATVAPDQSRAIHVVLICCILAFFLAPPQLLLVLKWNYLGGGSELEKIHPGTFLITAGFLAAFIIDPRFRERVLAVTMSNFSLVGFALCVTAAAAYAVLAHGASAAPFVDTFGSALIITIVLIAIPSGALMVLRTAIDVIFIVGIGIIFLEYALKRALIFDVNQLIYTTQGEFVYVFRPTGLFGSPMVAAEMFGLYSIANLVSTPIRHSFASIARVLLAILSFLAVFATGGRAPLFIAALVAIAFLGMSAASSLMRGYVNTVAIGMCAALACLVALIAPIMAQIGLFDLMLDRFTNDYGSGLARELAWQIMTGVSLQDLWFGLPLAQVFAMQNSYGLIAIEVTWINFILVCGLALTIPLFVSYVLFLFRSNAKYCQFGIYFIALYQLLLSYGSNGLWAKTTGLSMGLAIAFSFLRRDLGAAPEEAAQVGSRRRLGALPG